jgi:hypothetical protein
MRGATAPTAGSAKCGNSASSQPGPGAQSESRNATSGVSAAAKPVFLAAPGPPFTARRTTRAPTPRDPRYRGWIPGAVIDHDHPRYLCQPGQAAAELGLAVADRDHHSEVPEAPYAAARYGMRDVGVEQTASQRLGPRVVRYRRPGPPAGHVTGASRGEPQHPDR